MDPFLHSINGMLMEEEEEDATSHSTQPQLADGGASYQAVLRSFYDIIGEQPPPKSSLIVPTSSSAKSLFDLHQSALPANLLNNAQCSSFQEDRADASQLNVVAAPQAISALAHWNALGTTNVDDAGEQKVSCWEINTNLTSSSGSRGSINAANFQLPSPYKDFPLKLAGVELSFDDLNLHDHYAALYVGEPGMPTIARKHGDKEKVLATAVGQDTSGRKSGKKRAAPAHAQEYVDLKDLIFQCAQAVAVGDARLANELLQHIRQEHGAFAHGNGSQRAAHYFSEALEARMKGTGADHFRAILHEQQKPSAATILKTYKHCYTVSPVVKATHYVANQGILKAAERASRLHIVDYGFKDYGVQWPFLINALADRKGGPPLLVITGIDSPQPGNNPAGRLEECGRRLAAHAKTYNVPFQYHAIASSKWEDLDSSSLHVFEDEVLVVNCIKSLGRVAADESVNCVSPRQKLLVRIHSLKPHLLIIADVSATYNSSFFLSRFREALYHYYNLFDMVDTVWGDSPERLMRERTYFGDILNIVACEGAERVERAETYKQWQVRIERAGFEQLLIPPEILARARSHVKQHYHKDFFVHDDRNKWVLLGWRGRTAMAMSAWKLSDAQGS